MAQKLNKKLVFVVGSLLIALVIGGAGIFLIRYRTDADRHIRAGDAAMAAGDFTKAAESYGRAVAKKRTNVPYLEKFLDATMKVRSANENDARERYGQSLAALASLARAERGKLERWRAYFDALVEQAEAVGSVAIWKSLSDNTKELAQASAPNSTGVAVAKIYSGYAAMRRAESLDDTERADALAKLAEAVTDPGLTPREKDLGYGAIARIGVSELARARSSGVAARIEAATKTADAAIAEAQAKSAGGLQTAIAGFERAIIDARGNAADATLREKIEDVRVAAEAAKLTGLESLNVAGILSRGGEFGAKVAADLLAKAIARNPDALMERRARALLVRPTDRADALREIEAALAVQRPTTGIVAASFDSNRLSCAIIRFDILFDDSAAAEGAEFDALVAKAASAREEIAKMLVGAADDSALLRADAKLAMSRKEFQQALLKLNEIFRKGSAIDLELYVLSAICSQQVGEAGRALELITNGLQLAPSNTQLLKIRAQLEIRTGRLADASATLRLVRSIDPNDKEAEEAEKRVAAAIAADPASGAGVAGGGQFADDFARVQEAIEAGNFVLARQLVASLRAERKDPDPRLERLAVAVELRAGDDAAAKALLASALERLPGDVGLARLNAVISTTDPVERVVMLSESADVPEPDRTVLIYLNMVQSAASVAQAADRERRLGASTAAATDKAAKRLAEGVSEWRAKARAADPMSPVLIESEFRDALRAKDYAAAGAVITRAREGKRDSTQVPLLEAQLLIAQGKLREAATGLERAIQEGNDASSVYRTLGSVLEELGNVEGALRQYEEAYKRRPDDTQTIRLLVGANVRSGNTQRALEVLRAARQVAASDEEIVNAWLALETQSGDRRLAIGLRENQYRASPADTQNAVALANFFAAGMPDRADIVTEGGQPAYTDAAWLALSEAQRNAALDQVRNAWRRRAEDIFAATLRRDPKNVDVAESLSGLLRSLGREADAERVLKDAVAAGGTTVGWRGHLALGALQLQINKRDAAEASFREAIAREEKATRDATRAVIELLLSQERFAMALPYLEDLVTSDPDPAVRYRLAESLMRVGRIDDARKAFDAAPRDGNNPRFGEDLLDGALMVATGDRLRAEGKRAEARAAYEAALAPYQRAKAQAPSSPQPFVQDAIAKRQIFQLTGDKTRYAEALAAADRAIALGATFLPACIVRADVLTAGGDIPGALGEYDRYLKLVPTSPEIRRRLVDLAVSSGNPDRAEAALRAAILAAPGEFGWHAGLGEVLQLRGRHADAASSFARADALRPDSGTFLRELDARIRAKDYRGVTEATRRRGDFVRGNPTARAYAGIALIGRGEASDGMKTLKESFDAAVAASTDANDRLVGEWFAVTELLYGPTELANAEKLFKEVVGADLSPRARVQLAYLAASSPSGGPQKMIEYLQPLEGTDFSKTPSVGAVALERLGTAYYLAGDCAKAVNTYERALAYSPDADVILNNFAYLCGDCLKDPERGLSAARRAVAIAPTRVEYLDTLGSLLIAKGEFTEALGVLDRAADIGTSAAVEYHRAQALTGLNRNSEARTACTKAMELNPDPAMKAKIEKLSAELK
jgi:tetratricopeptide (TPR) repeat protein